VSVALPLAREGSRGLQPVRLPTCQANGSGAAGAVNRYRQRCRFPQALGESPPPRDADAAGQPPGRALAREAALLTAHTMCSADAGSRS